MTAHEYLKQIKLLNSKIKQREQQIKYLRISASNVGAIRYDRDKVQVSITDSNVESLIIQYTQLEIEVEGQKLHLERLRDKIINQIQELQDDRYVNVLYKRYVELKSYELIAVEMNYSFDYVKELHRDALDNFESKHPTLSHHLMC